MPNAQPEDQHPPVATFWQYSFQKWPQEKAVVVRGLAWDEDFQPLLLRLLIFYFRQPLNNPEESPLPAEI